MDGFYVPPQAASPQYYQQQQQQSFYQPQQYQPQQQQQPQQHAHPMNDNTLSSNKMINNNVPGGGVTDGGSGGFGSFANIGLGLYGAEKAQQWFNSNNNFLNKSVNNVAILSSSVKYYFDIDTSYVIMKLKTILVPFMHKNWERIPEQVAGGVTYKSGRQDVNAPDLYIGVNSFVTYVLLVLFGYLFTYGSYSPIHSSTPPMSTNQPLVNGGAKILTGSSSLSSVASSSSSFPSSSLSYSPFNPDKMGIVLWRSAVTLVINYVVLRLSLYLTNSAIKVAMLDLASYAAYVFVYGSLCRLIGMFSTTLGIATWIYMAVAYGLFLSKTLQRVMVLESRNYGLHVKQNNYILVAVTLFQVAQVKWLML